MRAGSIWRFLGFYIVQEDEEIEMSVLRCKNHRLTGGTSVRNEEQHSISCFHDALR